MGSSNPLRSMAPWLLALGWLSAAAGTDPPCRPHLVPCNYAESFTGTIHWRSQVADSVEEVNVRVASGKATCEGSITNGAGKEAIRGAGLLAVEFGIGTDDEPEQPWYRIAASCPGADGAPAQMNGSEMSTYKQKGTMASKALEGSVKIQHPDADPDNGVTGTLALDWSLTRP